MWVNLYIDKKGWLEQNNLLAKISFSTKLKKSFLELLNQINHEGYYFIIYPYPEEDIDYSFDNSNEFLNTLIDFRNSKKNFSISIEKFHQRDERQSVDMLGYLKGEFIKLIPLYNFISWGSNNNYLGI